MLDRIATLGHGYRHPMSHGDTPRNVCVAGSVCHPPFAAVESLVNVARRDLQTGNQHIDKSRKTELQKTGWEDCEDCEDNSNCFWGFPVSGAPAHLNRQSIVQAFILPILAILPSCLSVAVSGVVGFTFPTSLLPSRLPTSTNLRTNLDHRVHQNLEIPSRAPMVNDRRTNRELPA